jgi:serine protease Do
MMLGVILLAVPAANGQGKAPGKPTELNLVQVNITTETIGDPMPVVEFDGKIIQNYRPRIVKLFPSTGIVLDDKGHVLAFLGYTWVDIYQRKPRVEVVDAQGQRHAAKLIGIDQSVRVAVILCQGAALKKTPLCEHCEFKDGDTIIVPLLHDPGPSQFETARILSVSNGADSSGAGGWSLRIDRPLSVVGAPLLNPRGEVIGLIADQPDVEFSAAQHGTVTVLPDILPVPQMLNAANKIIKTGGDIQTGWLGVQVNPEANLDSGVMITQVESDSPAHKAGLLPGDIMMRWNGAAIRDPLKLIQVVENTPLGSKAAIVVLRQGRAMEFSAVIEARKPQDTQDKLVFAFPEAMPFPGAQAADPDALMQAALGIAALALTPQLAGALQLPVQTGLLVGSVNPQTAFAVAGIEAGDVILMVDGVQVQSPQNFFDHIKSRGWGSRLILRLLHKGKIESSTVQLPKLPAASKKHPS